MRKQLQQLKRQSLLEERAHAMRHQPTPSEAKLFEAIRGGRLGVAFKRQVRIGGFIVDFLAPAAKLVVEVDGGSHAGRGAYSDTLGHGIRKHSGSLSGALGHRNRSGATN